MVRQARGMAQKINLNSNRQKASLHFAAGANSRCVATRVPLCQQAQFVATMSITIEQPPSGQSLVVIHPLFHHPARAGISSPASKDFKSSFCVPLNAAGKNSSLFILAMFEPLKCLRFPMKPCTSATPMCKGLAPTIFAILRPCHLAVKLRASS